MNARFVETLVERGREDAGVGRGACTRSTPSGAAMRHSAVIASAPRACSIVARGGERAAGREHRIDDVRRPAREVVRQPLQVGERPVGRLVALQADHAHLGIGQRGQHAVEQAEPGVGGSARRAAPGSPDARPSRRDRAAW